MPHKPKSQQDNPTHNEEFIEKKKIIEQQTRAAFLELSERLRERRIAAGLTQSDLVKLTGLSIRTIRSIETGNHTNITMDTYNRVRSISLLGFDSISHAHDSIMTNFYNPIYLPDYDPLYPLELASNGIASRSTRLPYESLHYSKITTHAYHQLVYNGSYGKWISSTHWGVTQLIAYLPSCIEASQVDFICLTVGHGWMELMLIDRILQSGAEWLARVFLVSPNKYLLDTGMAEFARRTSNYEQASSLLNAVLGRHESFIERLVPPRYTRRQRIFVLFGTMMNHENCRQIAMDISGKMKRGDILIFDINLSFGDLNNRKAIFLNDPRLCGNLPEQYVKSVENCCELSLMGIDHAIKGISWSYGIDRLPYINQQSMAEYSIDVSATLYRDSIFPQIISPLMIHRHNPETLRIELSDFGLLLIEKIPFGVDSGINYPGFLLVFKKT